MRVMLGEVKLCGMKQGSRPNLEVRGLGQKRAPQRRGELRPEG